jgi:glutamate-1-semialdehyde 2,1-aminomutase
MAAGIATLETLDRERPWEALDQVGARLEAGLAKALDTAHVPGVVTRVGSMGTAFFLGDAPTDYASVKRADTARFGRFHGLMLERGVYLPPSQFEAWFLSTQHDDAIVDQVIAAAEDALGALALA